MMHSDSFWDFKDEIECLKSKLSSANKDKEIAERRADDWRDSYNAVCKLLKEQDTASQIATAPCVTYTNPGSADTHRTFATGAVRDLDRDKLDYEGFLSPQVLEGFAQFMHKNQHMPDGSYRASDNWQKGIPQESYVKSLIRHTVDFWRVWRLKKAGGLELAYAIMFNIMGWILEELKKNQINFTEGDKQPKPAPTNMQGDGAWHKVDDDVFYGGAP